MEWLASQGALVWIPLGHSPDIDLMAELDGRMLRIQVKTSILKVKTPNGHDRWQVSIVTSGGNRSWSGTSKSIDRGRVDHLFALVGDGRRWLIPANLVEGSRAVVLGGMKYSEFEIERGASVESLVYGTGGPNKLRRALEGECQSGQMDVTVNHTAMPTQVRILPPPSTMSSRQVLLRPKRQATFPKAPCEEAGITPGDRLRAKADGPGRIVFERIEEPVA
jgi:hypothetical protein